MAKFEMELPNEIIKDFQKLYQNSDRIFGDMTKAGAEVVLKNMKSNIPASFRDSEIMRCLKVTKVYKTPSDDGINCKVGFYGYFYNKNGERVPAPLVVNVYEYGRSNSPFPKHPFVRKSFKKKEIEQAMLAEQKRLMSQMIEGFDDAELEAYGLK